MTRPERPSGLVPLSEITAEEWASSYGSEDEPARVLERTRKMLVLAQRGLAELHGDAQADHLGGICDVATYGRSVTLVAQHARTRARDAFNAWYAPWEAEMKKDDLFQYFVSLRNQILKEGAPRAMGYRHAPDGMRFVMAAQRVIDQAIPEHSGHVGGKLTSTQYYENPPGALHEVTLPSGETLKRWVPLPAELFVDYRWSTYLPEPPKIHRDEPIRDITLQGLSTMYVGRLSEFVEAFADFISSL